MLLAAVTAVSLSACGSRDGGDGGADTTVSTAAAGATTSEASTTTVTPPASTTVTTTATTTATTGATTPGTSTATPTTTAAAPTTTIDGAAAIAQITANWEKFFMAGTPLSERVPLLENGSQYLEALTIRSADPLQAQASAKVREVTLTDAQHAHVIYDVSLGETVALPGAEGNAVLQDGTWKVSAESFCSLISLGATEPIPGC